MAVPGVEDVKKALPSLKSFLSLGAFGKIATAGGALLLPFFLSAAGGAAIAAGATNLSVLTSFWAPLFTGTSGQVGLTAGLPNMFNGAASLFGSGKAILSSAFSAVSSGSSPIAAVKTALMSPVLH